MSKPPRTNYEANDEIVGGSYVPPEIAVQLQLNEQEREPEPKPEINSRKGFVILGAAAVAVGATFGTAGLITGKRVFRHAA